MPAPMWLGAKAGYVTGELILKRGWREVRFNVSVTRLQEMNQKSVDGFSETALGSDTLCLGRRGRSPLVDVDD